MIDGETIFHHMIVLFELFLSSLYFIFLFVEVA